MNSFSQPQLSAREPLIICLDIYKNILILHSHIQSGRPGAEDEVNRPGLKAVADLLWELKKLIIQRVIPDDFDLDMQMSQSIRDFVRSELSINENFKRDLLAKKLKLSSDDFETQLWYIHLYQKGLNIVGRISHSSYLEIISIVNQIVELNIKYNYVRQFEQPTQLSSLKDDFNNKNNDVKMEEPPVNRLSVSPPPELVLIEKFIEQNAETEIISIEKNTTGASSQDEMIDQTSHEIQEKITTTSSVMEGVTSDDSSDESSILEISSNSPTISTHNPTKEMVSSTLSIQELLEDKEDKNQNDTKESDHESKASDAHTTLQTKTTKRKRSRHPLSFPKKNKKQLEPYATSEGILKTLVTTLGETAHIILPEQNSIFNIFNPGENGREAAINLADLIKTFITSDGGNLKQPVVGILNTNAATVTNKKDGTATGGKHWICLVILPKNYQKSDIQHERIYLVDSLNQFIKLPNALMEIFANGYKFEFEAPLSEKDNTLIKRTRIEAAVLANAEFMRQPSSFRMQQYGGADCGWWAIDNAFKIIESGNTQTLIQPIRARRANDLREQYPLLAYSDEAPHPAKRSKVISTPSKQETNADSQGKTDSELQDSLKLFSHDDSSKQQNTATHVDQDTNSMVFSS